LGEAYRATGELDRALEEYERAKEYNTFLPGDEADLASCYFGQARVYEAQRNWEAAMWHYEAGLQVTPDAAAYAALGRIHHYELRDLGTAEALFKQAIALDPQEAWWHVSLGELYVAEEKYEQAVAELEDALSLGGNAALVPDVHDKLGRCYYALGQFERAVDAYQHALALDPQYNAARKGLEDALNALENRR
jgi:tetratricopeptide (TPR) repeat protein